MIISQQRIGINGQIQNDGKNADKIDKHGNCAEEIFKSQGTEQIKTENVEKKQESKCENIVFIFEIQRKSWNEKRNNQAEEILESELAADFFFFDYFGFEKDGILD
jgi:endonuclease I